MVQCRITVLKKMFNQDLFRIYCAEKAEPCPVFQEGQQFIYNHSGDGKKPQNFCEHAWHDIYGVVMTLAANGDYEGWMKNKRTCIVCCTDGLRPVVFNVEREV